MKKLILSNFKAFGDAIAEFGGEDTDGRPLNILCYGENGAGKSSVYEAVKYVFHKERIEQEKVPPHLTGVARQNAVRQILIDYKNSASANPTSISINGHSFNSFDTSDYNVYMIESRNLVVDKQINVKDLLKRMYLGKHNIDTTLTPLFFSLIIEETNKVLKDTFFENIKVSESSNGQFILKIEDDQSNLHFDDDLNLHFNEAKLHLIVLVFALSSICLMAPGQDGQKRILVLDDFITSLDTANRSFLYQYITTQFDKFQIIIFTHNTSFYNLCDHFLKENNASNNKWLRQGIFEYNGKRLAYSRSNGNRLAAIETELSLHPERIHDIGNDIRQYFEVLLHQLSLMLMAGAKEETQKILLEIAQKSNNRFFHIDEHGISDLMTLFDKIRAIIKNAPESEQLGKIKNLIQKFNDTSNSADKLSENIQAMAIYQKVALHQSSHGHEGLPDLSVKEIKSSIHLLKKIESTIEKMKIERI